MKQLQGEQSGAGYIPFSEEWEKEVSKLPKVFLIEMLKKANLERIEYRDKLAASNPVQSVKQGQAEEWVKHQQEQYGDAAPSPQTWKIQRGIGLLDGAIDGVEMFRSEVNIPGVIKVLTEVKEILTGLSQYRQSPQTAGAVWPTDEQIAVELIARYNGNARGNKIAKKSFVDAIEWLKTRSESSGDKDSERELNRKLHDKLQEALSRGVKDYEEIERLKALLEGGYNTGG